MLSNVKLRAALQGLHHVADRSAISVTAVRANQIPRVWRVCAGKKFPPIKIR
jgi:hypothetical protein